LLGIGVVFLLLRRDRLLSQGLSSGLWIPTLWVLYCASRPVSNWLGGGGGDVEEGSGADRIFLVTLIVSALVVLARRRFDWGAALRANGWLVALYCYALISILWS
jgi:hypothetical protein